MPKGKKIRIAILAGVLIAALLGAVIALFVVPEQSSVRGPGTVDRNVPGQQIALDSTYWVNVDPADTVFTASAGEMTVSGKTPSMTDGAAAIAAGDTVQMTVHVAEAGEYALVLTYKTVGSTLAQSTVSVDFAGSAVKSYINSIWCDASKAYIFDRYNNEVTPSQVKVDAFATDYVRDSTTLDLEPVRYGLEAGSTVLTIENNDQDILLQSVQLVKYPKAPAYSVYAAAYDRSSHSNGIIIEGEDYIAKSDSYVRTKADINSSCYPYSSYQKLLNAVDYYSWQTAGQRVVWQFYVEYAGWYNLGFHYTQSEKEGQSVYRNVEIDGKTLFSQMNEMAFPYTGSEYANVTLQADGENARIYLTEGKHTIALYTSVPAMAPVVEQINQISAELSEIGLDLQQVAGSNADANRTWDIESYIPGVTDHLYDLQQRLTALYDSLSNSSGTAASSCVNLKQAASIIEQALKRPDKLPTYVTQLSVGSGSVTDLLAQLVNTINEQGISLDRIYVYGDGYVLPDGEAGFLGGLVAGTRRFFHSLVNREGAYGVGAATDEEDAITVWVNRPISYVETLQLLTDTYFTPETGIKVYFSVMPDEGKLLLANASDTCPDVALGVTSDRPYQLGARGAAYDLTQFSDFAAYVRENFNDYDLEPFTYDGAIYGIPETKNFYVLMYRTDILERLELEAPDTWNDVAEMMPVLRRSGMTFYMPLSAATGTKPLSTIAPFFLQNGAKLYSEDGLTSVLNSEEGIAAFSQLTDLYTLYSVQNNAPSFYNNFRYGAMPVGVGSFSDYVQMLYAAPEIADKWTIAPAPGTVMADGTVNRQQVSVDRSDLIMNTTKKEDQAWTFLKWWMSTGTQVEFAYSLQTKYGSEYAWNSANKEAFTQLSFPKAHRDVILEQWSESENYRIMPATYMLERCLSDAWYSVVNEHQSPRAALNEAVFTIDQETAIRMQQFGYLDETGNVVREYDMRSVTEILDEVSGR